MIPADQKAHQNPGGGRDGEPEIRRLRRAIEILEEEYGVPQSRGLGPIDILVQTILSQNTTSANAHRAFDNLKRRYPDYGPLLAASDEEVAGLIRCGGLANIKTRRIKEALEKIRERRGGREIEEAGERKEEGGEAAGYDATGTDDPIELDFLAGLDPQEAREYLLTLPGVGPKTAAVVLLFGFSMPFIPVDTHVNRLSRRLGFVPEDAAIDEAERVLEEITPQDKRCSFHVNLIRHGRAVCKARSPLCPNCVLGEICPYPHLGRQKG
ncbi:endonuclease III domain-containing protein [Candidatus Methanocrinis natronophilus]|uniref:Endonuclease III n=1 Tax=Candidatus Methanocrinis natronophilus TaxID=3033396 RepID=A0ABT5X974_9EURY|nr:endonuclease III [Candidatus Methanocrinis natronophilus]MDF0591208.1 endonuclease III [Candidatus Methanocrinis natronophilus]